MSNINVGVIGAGWIAEKYLDIIFKKKLFNLYAISSRTNSKAIKLKNKYNIKKFFNNYKQMLNDENINAYLLLVSAENIYKITIDLIENQKPFLVEKPIFLKKTNFNLLIKLLKKNKTKNMVAMNRRYYSIFNKGIKILNKKGKILGISIEGHERFYNIKKNEYHHDVYKSWIYANSCHTIDLFRHFCGEIKSVKSIVSKYNKRKSNFASTLLFSNGIVGNYVSYWNSPDGWSVKIYGEGITLVYKPLEQGYFLNKKMIKTNISKSSEDELYKDGFYLMLIDFKKLILNKKVSSSFQSINDHLKTVDLISKINNE